MSSAAQFEGGDQVDGLSPLASPLSRLIAYVIDVTVVLAITFALVRAIGWMSAFSLAIVLVQLLYFTVFESSPVQASPGKLLLGLRVVTVTGDRISFGRALSRNVAKAVTATFGFLFRLRRGRPAYHDSLAGSTVLRREFRLSFVGNAAPTNRAGHIVGWVIVGVVFAVVLARGFLSAFTLNVAVVGYAMWPTYLSGQHVMAVRTSYLFSIPQRSDVIVFHAVSAGAPDRVMIERIVGLPGDQVQVSHGAVYINGHSLSTPPQWQAPNYEWGPQVVPPHDYFVLGDNRSNSFDSHDWPVSPWVSRGDIVGKVH